MASLRHPNVVQFMGVSAFPPAMITGEGRWAGRRAAGCLVHVCAGVCVGRAMASASKCMHVLFQAMDSTCDSRLPGCGSVGRPLKLGGTLGVCAEYCGKGSLTDVLKGGRLSTQKANLLPWHRRINMVRAAAMLAGTAFKGLTVAWCLGCAQGVPHRCTAQAEVVRSCCVPRRHASLCFISMCCGV
jgi:hypothetical protein